MFDDATIRPTIAISPSRSASSVVPRSITDGDRLVDVLAVAPRADVPLRIERRFRQRARRPSGPDDPRRARHERAGGVGRHPDAEEVGAILVLVVILVRIDLLAVLRLGTGLDEDAFGVAVPAERQRPGAERLVERLIERPGVDVGRRRALSRLGRLDAAPFQLGQELTQPVGEDCDLDLLRGPTLTTRGPSRAWRKNVRSPGWPTVPATKRSGGSKR